MVSNTPQPIAPHLNQYRSARTYAILATLLLIAVGVVTFLSIGANNGQADLISQMQDGKRISMAVAEASDSKVQMMAYAFIAAFVVAGIGFFLWIYRASVNIDNLTIRGEMGPQFSPASAVYWWFVPFANWVQPFRVMREIWIRSGSPGAVSKGVQALLVLWWGLWLVCSGLGIRAWTSSPSFLAGEEAYWEQVLSQTYIAILNDSLILVNAVIAIGLVWAITLAQERKVKGLRQATV